MLNVKKTLTKILDALKTDYVIEQGVTNGWRYRKWNSGVCECWTRQTKTRSGTSTNFSLTLPFTFKYPPMASVSGGATGNISARVEYVQTTTTNLDAYVNASSGTNVWLSAYICDALA